MAKAQQGYSGKRAAEVVGITYRQLDYWARTDLIRPSLAEATGSGSRRRYSYRDLLELRVIKTLLDAGIKLESVRGAFSYLRENLGEDVASAQLVICGTSWASMSSLTPASGSTLSTPWPRRRTSTSWSPSHSITWLPLITMCAAAMSLVT